MATMDLPAKFEAAGRLPGQPWPISEAAKFFALSVRSLERANAAGRLRAIKLGRLTYIPDEEVRRIANEGL